MNDANIMHSSHSISNPKPLFVPGIPERGGHGVEAVHGDDDEDDDEDEAEAEDDEDEEDEDL